MTYAAIDTSTDAGAPYELFEFTEGARSWRYTTSPHSDNWGGHEWSPRPIAREAIVRDSGSIGDPITITLPDNDPLALELLAGLTMHQVAVRIRQLHRGDTEARILFTGLVAGVSFRGASASISCGSRFTLVSKRRVAPTTFQAGCNLSWGSARCGVNAEVFRVNTVASASDQVGRTLTLPGLIGYPAGHFNGGKIALGTTRRFIEKHTAGGVLTLAYPLGGLTSTPEPIGVYPNCQKTEADCAGRYGNLVNYLGWSRLPSVNPYNRSAYYLQESGAVAPPAGSTGDLPGHPGYQILLAPSAFTFGASNDTTLTLEFHADGTAHLRVVVMAYEASYYDEQVVAGRGWYVASDTSLPVTGMWGTPLPVPGYGDTTFRVDAVGTPAGVTLTGFSLWTNPSPSVVLTAAGDFPAGTLTWTVRIRNRTTGVVIAQGNLTVTFTASVVDQQGAGGDTGGGTNGDTVGGEGE